MCYFSESPVLLTPMARKSASTSPGNDGILVNKLTVRDGVHLLRNEGGEITAGRALFRAVTVLIVAAFMARAIVLGQATAWHLFLPMVGEYLVLMLSLPVINLIIRDPDLRKNARQSVNLLIGIAVIAALWIASRSFDTDHLFREQATIEFARLLHWITSHEMHWPIIGASVAMLMSLPGRVAAFHRHGPPFVAVGMGCAMRLVVALFGCFLLPAVMSDPSRIVWAIWTILLLSEIGALSMHWDLQKRLRKRGIEI